MLWYIMVCSMIGGISVSVTTGLGAAIVTTASGHNQVSPSSSTLLFTSLKSRFCSLHIGSFISF
jgi:hypothetical protein